MNKFLKVLKSIGAVITWPFKHEHMIEEVCSTVKADLPPTYAAMKTLAQMFVKAGPDALGALAAKGFDIPDDLRTLVDIKAIAAYVKDTFLPTVEKDFEDLKFAIVGEQVKDSPAPSLPPAAPAQLAVADPAPANPVVTAATQTTLVQPGLHNQIPA